MNTLLVFTVLFAGACMADVSHIVDQRPQIAILESTQDSDPSGNYQYGYKTENGISVEAQGSPTGDAKGSYHYIAPDGTPIDVTWISGPNGYFAEGSGVPPTPESVLRTLEYNAAHPYKEPVQP